MWGLLLGVVLWGRAFGINNWHLFGARLTIFATAGLVFLGVFPVGAKLLVLLENRFPIPQTLPESVDGIIALVGVADSYESAKRGQFQIGSAVERITGMVEPAKQYPKAKIAFSGGSGGVTLPEAKEADAIKKLLTLFAIDQDRIIYERESRNTF